MKRGKFFTAASANISHNIGRAYSRDTFLGGTFVKKKGILLTCTPKTDAILIISNQNTFFKTRGARLGVIVAPNKGLEWALIGLKCALFAISIFIA